MEHQEKVEHKKKQATVNILSLRPGDIILHDGSKLLFNQVMEIGKDEADSLLQQFPQFLRIL